MYKFEMPERKADMEINKPDPYPFLSEGMKRVKSIFGMLCLVVNDTFHPF